MAVISVGGLEFYVQPNTASWSYAMNIKPFDTYGGRVVQLLSCNVESFSIEGHIRPKRWDGNRDAHGRFDVNQWQGMREFESNVKAIMAYHESEKAPVTFNLPEVGWYGQVYLVGYGDVRYKPELSAVTYTLQFEVDSGFTSIQQAASDEGLANIPDGVGWVRNVYNTPAPDSWEKVKKALEEFVDDAGSFDASNPADFYRYLEKAMDSEGGESIAKTTADKISTVATAASDVFTGKKTAEEAVSFMQRHGISAS